MTAELLHAPEAAADEAGLVYVSDAEPGFSRRRRGRGFAYHRPDGSAASAAERARIEALVLPPAWADVWVCADPRGHLQATGRDEKGRKQYRYHPRWQHVRSRAKYDQMVPFAEALPTLRARVDADLRGRAPSRDRVLALAAALLDETLVRIGNAAYAAENGSFGLTTLRDRHARVEGGRLVLSFKGKSGKDHALEVADRRLARLVKACRDIPGHTLFQYLGDDGRRQAIDSGMVNAYLRETMGGPFSAKCFRTWGGTVLAAETLAEAGPATDEAACAKAVTATVKTVAGALGNTVAVCRAHYVHPAVLDAFASGDLSGRLRRRHAGNTPAGLRPAEAAVLDLLRADAQAGA